MVTRNQYAQSEIITVKSLFFWEISANEGCCLHSSVASQVSQHLSSFQEQMEHLLNPKKLLRNDFKLRKLCGRDKKRNHYKA